MAAGDISAGPDVAAAGRNRCGTCTMCCKIVGVAEIEKAPNSWCRHCDIGSGCRIYDSRPPSCAKFDCFWFVNRWVADELRPDRCKVVFDGMREAKAVLAMVDPARPDAWKARPVERFIGSLVRRFDMAVVVTWGPGQDREPVFILPDGRTREDVVAGLRRHRSGVVERLAEQEGLSWDAAQARIASLRTEVR